jgi:rod shape-determining protein MreD
VRRAVFAAAAVLVAVVLQTVLLDRLPFPGGSAPDLVLVLVVTLALASGPMEGMLIGFGAGLALDVAPPASNLLGLSALVFCLVGYGCGRLRGPLERSAWLPLGVVALGVAAGEALYALIGMIFGDPDITWQSVRLVLPVSVVYDLLLCPFVVYVVVKFGGYGGWATTGVRRADLTAGRDLAGAGGVLGGVAAAGAVATGAAVRDTRSGRDPRLRAAAGRGGDGWIGGHQNGLGPAGPWVHRRRPLQLRARGGVAGSAAGTGLGRRTGPPAPGRPVHLRLGAPRRGDGVLGGSLRSLLGGGPAGLLGGSGRESRMRGAAFRGSIGLMGAGSAVGGSRPGSARLSARAFRGSGGPASTLHDGSSRGPLTRPRRRSHAFRGGPSALSAAGTGGRRATPLRLRARRRDGVVGGGVLGGRARGAGPGGGRTMSGAAFAARRSPGAPGALRSGHGQGAVPRFKSGGLRRWADRMLPGRRGSLPGGGGGLGGRRGFGGRRRGFGAGRGRGLGPPHRWTLWRTGSKRTGGRP